MADFNVRSESVDVEQIMGQIRGRIKEKRGVDYTEEQVRALASVRLEKFLDPKNLRSDLLEQFRKSRPPLPDPDFQIPEPPPTPEPPYVFDAETLYRSHRAPLRFIRRLLSPILKLFFNPNTLIQILHTQSQFNVDVMKRDLRRRYELDQAVRQQSVAFERSRAEWNLLYYEVLHNLVLETTRNGIEVKNLRMRIDALASRLDFSERRVRALEGVVQYRPDVLPPRPARVPNGSMDAIAGDCPVQTPTKRRNHPPTRRSRAKRRPSTARNRHQGGKAPRGHPPSLVLAAAAVAAAAAVVPVLVVARCRV